MINKSIILFFLNIFDELHKKKIIKFLKKDKINIFLMWELMKERLSKLF